MKLDSDAIIAQEKIRDYLLKARADNDKSKFLSRAGYTQANWRLLLEDIRTQILLLEADFLQNTDYGVLWKITGMLKGPNGVSIRVATIWMRERHSGMTKFITLFPDKGGQA